MNCENCENYKPKPEPPKSAMENIFDLVQCDISVSTLRLQQPLLDAARAEWEAMGKENEALRAELVKQTALLVDKTKKMSTDDSQPGEVERELIEAWDKWDGVDNGETFTNLIIAMSKFKCHLRKHPTSPTELEKEII